MVRHKASATLRWLALLVTVGAVAACSSNNNSSTNNKSTNTGAVGVASATTAGGAPRATTVGGTAAAGPAKSATIGVAFSLTGAAAQYGQTQKNGAQLAADQINAGAIPGLKLTLIIEDDGSAKDQGISVLQKFITQDKVNAIIGPTLSNTALAADPVAQQAKVPVLGVSTTATGVTDIGDYIFRDSLAEADVIPQTVQATQTKLGYKSVAILYANDDAVSTAGYNIFKAALDKAGVKIVDTEQVGTNDKDFSAQLTKVRDAKPDALIVSTLLDAAVGITTQARKLGITAPIIGGNGLNTPALIKGAGQDAEGVIVGAAWNSASTNPLSQKFIQDYKAKYNSDPDQFAAQAYAGVYILAHAIQLANSTDRQAIRDALPKVQNYDTVLGSFSFTEKRDAQHTAIIQVVKSGAFVPLQ